MKLFGGSKNGKHTGGAHTGRNEIPKQDLNETVYFDTSKMEQSAEPAVETPVVEPVAEQADPMVEMSPQPTPEVETAELTKEEKEDGLINSIVEAVGLADKELQDTGSMPPVQHNVPTGPVPPVQAPPKKGKKGLIIAASVLGVLLLIVAAALLVVSLWITPPDVPGDDSSLVTPTPSADVGSENNGEDEVQQRPENGTGRKEGTYTFAIVGKDVASGNTDTIMVGKLDTIEGTMNVISIPRDTLINYGTNKINAAYAIGENKEKGKGVENLLNELKKLVGFEIDSYAIVDTIAVEELIDAIGGVYYDVPQDMIYRDPYQNLNINISKGYQKLSGADAVKVLRFRDGYAGGDIERIGVQQDFLMAIAEQMLDLGNIPNISKAVEIYEERVTTNLTTGNIFFYVSEFLKLDKENIRFMTMPGNTQGSINGGSYVFIYVDEWLEMINEYLNPFYTDVTEYNVSIKTSTNGTSFTYTAGA